MQGQQAAVADDRGEAEAHHALGGAVVQLADEWPFSRTTRSAGMPESPYLAVVDGDEETSSDMAATQRPRR
ncbi:hypothetical protein, partial [Nonomuraea rubra]|uniref:hypothetical protein n=1 Tax=Nonomuraea rubra TaxID=46180 RepID=UPI0031F0C581